MESILAKLGRLRGFVVERECVLSAGSRIDFLIRNSCQSVGLEVKVKGALASVQRQLERYARDPRVESLILATTRATHLRLEETFEEQPLPVPLRLVHLRPF
jgi:hypothetical protein